MRNYCVEEIGHLGHFSRLRLPSASLYFLVVLLDTSGIILDHVKLFLDLIELRRDGVFGRHLEEGTKLSDSSYDCGLFLDEKGEYWSKKRQVPQEVVLEGCF